MERTEVLDMMSSLKLYGMRSAYDETLATAIKRKHEPHPPLRHHRDRQRQLALQEPRLIFSRRLFRDPRFPPLRNPNQLRRGERCRLDPSSTKGSPLHADPGLRFRAD